jgi:hypothetical protein
MVRYNVAGPSRSVSPAIGCVIIDLQVFGFRTDKSNCVNLVPERRINVLSPLDSSVSMDGFRWATECRRTANCQPRILPNGGKTPPGFSPMMAREMAHSGPGAEE